MAVNKIIAHSKPKNITETRPNHFKIETFIKYRRFEHFLYYKTILKVTNKGEIMLVSLSKGTAKKEK